MFEQYTVSLHCFCMRQRRISPGRSNRIEYSHNISGFPTITCLYDAIHIEPSIPFTFIRRGGPTLFSVCELAAFNAANFTLQRFHVNLCVCERSNCEHL